jgi:adenylate kinase
MRFTCHYFNDAKVHHLPRRRRTTSKVQGTALPTNLNTIPHARDTRKFFYDEAKKSMSAALKENQTRMLIRCKIPELNTDFDVYRVGTLLELIRELATTLAADGGVVKVCVQQALGQGVFQGTPLSLNGVMRIMKQMDWGDCAGSIKFGNIYGKEVEDADAFVLISPQNMTGQSIVPFLKEMAEAAEESNKPFIIVNPQLTDVPSSGGIMGVRGRAERQNFVLTFPPAYHFRLLYRGSSMYPIMGALRYRFGNAWEVYRRDELGPRQEEYKLIGIYDKEPGGSEITECFRKSYK